MKINIQRSTLLSLAFTSNLNQDIFRLWLQLEGGLRIWKLYIDIISSWNKLIQINIRTKYAKQTNNLLYSRSKGSLSLKFLHNLCLNYCNKFVLILKPTTLMGFWLHGAGGVHQLVTPLNEFRDYFPSKLY